MTISKSYQHLRPVLSYALFCVISIFISQSANADFGLDINQINEVTHLEIPGLSASDYQMKNQDGYVELLVSGLDAKSVEKLRRYSDQHIKKITVSKSASLSQDIIKIQLVGKATQVFDYLTDAPAALSIDFYVDDKESAKEPIRAQAKNSSEEPFLDEVAVKKTARKPASDEFIKTAADPEAEAPVFEIIHEGKHGQKKKEVKTVKEISSDIPGLLDFDSQRLKFKQDSVIESRGKISLKFPVLINPNKQLTALLKKKVHYQVEPTEDAETNDMMVIKEFFSKNDYKNFLRGREVYTKKHPGSRYTEMLAFMAGDALYELYKTDKSKILLEESLSTYDAVVNRYPNSPLTERTLLFTSWLRMENGEYFGAIRNLKTYVKNYEKSPLRDSMELYLAHCLIQVNQNDDALKIFERLMNSPDRDVQRQATFEIGDTFFEKKDYKKAIQYYDKALVAYPESAKNYANVYYNKAESEFVEEDYATAAESFKNFLKYFPLNPHASYAWTRLGEIFEISDQEEKKWRGYYNEGVFRFNNSPGAAIAKVHLLHHAAVNGEERRLPMAIADMRALQKSIPIKQADEFTAFNISDIYFKRKKYKEAAQELITFFKSVKLPTYAEKFHRRIGRAISFQMREKIEQNKLDEAFSILDSYDPLWIKKSERIDFHYLKGMAFEKSRVYKKAASEYKAFLDKYKKLGNQEEITVIENLPVIDEIYLRAAVTQYQLNNIADAKELMGHVDPAKMSASDKDENYLILAKIADREAQEDSALKYLSQIKKDNLESSLLKVKFFKESKKYQQAFETIDAYLDKGNPDPSEKFQALKTKLSLLEAAGKKDKYYSFSSRFFDEYKDSKFDFDEEKYKLGLHLSENGKTKEAETVWGTIQAGSMWKKLAEDSQNEKKWASQYKKYIDRIPAMSNESKEDKK